MLNIIGPRLPAERGVFAHMEETFDHMDMVKSTNPPLVVGLLNQRDSISLTDTPEGSRDKIDSDEISTLFSSMFTQAYANNDSSELSNPMFVKKSQILGLPRLFLSLFGSRYRYMLQVDPYLTMKNSSLKSEILDEYCQKLAQLWDSRENRIFEVGPYNREVLMKQQGITGAHIANIVKWISLIDKNCLSRFMGRNIVESVELCQQMTGPEKIWDMVRSGPKPTFDIGVLRTDSSIGRFLEKDSKYNETHFEKGLSSLGVHNAEILRSIGPAYLNSFLPIELLFAIVSDSIRVESFDYRSFGLSESSFSEHVDESDMDIIGFASTVIETIKQNHGLNATGIVNDPEQIIDYLFDEYESELNCVLDHFDLKLIRNGSKFKLRLHPRLNRYFSAVRDIPTRSVDKLLPARSAPASLSRYLNSDSLDKPLDPDYIRENRTGIASPTFTLGGNIINQMRYMSLLPDEGKLSLIPLMRILMLGTGDKSELEKRLGYQLSNIGINLDEISPLVERIFSHRYSKTEVFKEPGIYSNQIMILVNRLNEIRPLLSYLIEKPPSGWSKFDISALNYLIDDVVSKDEITFGGIENTNQIFGSGVESIPNLRSWLQDVVNMLILSSPIGDETDSEPEVLQEWTDDKGHTWRSMDNGTTLWWNPTDKEWKPFDNPTVSNEKEVDESDIIQTVSGGNPVIVGLKQLFYDIAYNFNEALGQAEYLDKDYKNSRSVHFEMTGFSDRLIGKPKGLLILVHDRNPKLPMDSVQQSIRESINYNFGENLGNPKAFSTAADFGPTSYLTVVLQNSPAADISDQFQMLLHDRSEGLAGNNPFWAFENSKLHPYIFLYNLLWLSTRIDKWTDLGNKEYIRRFQIPTGIIEHHFCDPVKLDNDRIRLEKEKQSFPGDITMPEDDSRDYNTAIKGHLSGIRNILPLIGIMALRYEKAGKLEEKELWKEFELDRTEYAEMVDMLMSDANLMEKEHLYRDEVKQSKSKVVNPFLKKKVVSGGGAKDEDTIETRARAWFKAYGAWKNYSKNNPQEDTRVDEASKFEVNFVKPKPDDSNSGEIEIEDLLKEDG
jgi:hypothetical protein